MRSSIEHSGSVNGDPRYTFRLVEVDANYANVSLNENIVSLRFEMTQAELKDLIWRARFALEDCRLSDLFHGGGLTAAAYEEARRDLDRNGPPLERQSTPTEDGDG